MSLSYINLYESNGADIAVLKNGVIITDLPVKDIMPTKIYIFESGTGVQKNYRLKKQFSFGGSENKLPLDTVLSLTTHFDEVLIGSGYNNNGGGGSTVIALNDPIDNFALYHPSKYFNLTDAQIDSVADLLITNKSTWASVHYDTARPNRLNYVTNFIQRLKAKGLKVHLRSHHTDNTGFVRDSLLNGDNDGQAYNFAIGLTSIADSSATSGTISTITDTSKNWTVDQWKGFQCYTTGGTGNNKTLYIASNTATTLTFIATGDFAVSSIAFDATTKYKINYKKFNDRSFDDPNFGYRKFVKDLAVAGLAAGADSFSVSNELSNVTVNGVVGAMLSNDTGYVQAQKDLVTYIKAQVPGYVAGYTTSDLFWKADAWIASGALGSLDYFGYTAYSRESDYFYTLKRLCDTFGASNIQQDEMSLSGTYEESFARNVVTSAVEYAKLLSTRVKYAKNLGIKNIFKFQLWDANGTSRPSSNAGFGYLNNIDGDVAQTVGIPNSESWVANSYSKVWDTVITNYSLGFRPGKRALEINNNTNLNLGSSFTFQKWIHITASNNNSTIVKKDSSYIFRFENNKLTTHLWTTNNSNVQIQDTVNFDDNYGTDRWVHVAWTYDGANQNLFVGGILKATGVATGAVVNNTNNLAIGGQIGGGDEMDGRIQDFELCNTVLYTTNFTPPTVTPNNSTAILRLRMDEGTGTTVTDTSINANNGTLAGAGTSIANWFIGKYDTLTEVPNLSTIDMGILPAKYTTTSRNAILNPTIGSLIYNSTTNKLNLRTATTWEVITSV